jgi:hypothetical protein
VSAPDSRYAEQKLFAAVLALATIDAPLKARLRLAATDALLPKEDAFPEVLRERYRKLRGSLTAKAAKGDEGAVAATLRGMRSLKASELATEIVELHEALARRP